MTSTGRDGTGTLAMRLAGLTMAAAIVLVACGGESCADCRDTDGYRIEFTDPAVGPGHPAVVLFSGWRDGTCQYDVLCTGTEEVFLGDMRREAEEFRGLDWSAFCRKEELLAFASERSPTPPEGPNWVFGSAATVDVTLWMVAGGWGGATAWAERERHALRARRIYEELGTGINLRVTPRTDVSPVLQPAVGTGFGCDEAFRAAQLTVNTGFDPKTINVYYVKELAGPFAAVTCPGGPAADAPWNVVFISNLARLHALAHELGHALGLVRSAVLPDGDGVEAWTGDTDELDVDPQLGQGNLMYYGENNPQLVTLGQVYRMHFDVLSWLGQSRPDARDCQDSPFSSGACPPLALNPPRGWP